MRTLRTPEIVVRYGVHIVVVVAGTVVCNHQNIKMITGSCYFLLSVFILIILKLNNFSTYID